MDFLISFKQSEYYLKMAVDAGLPRAKTKYEQYKSEYESELEKQCVDIL